ncbi:MAG TPA: STAS domain-containing protein [Geobacteraceae bacterium]|nr:STAS domain-containing protein [Geobacteraceae bacterium]
MLIYTIEHDRGLKQLVRKTLHVEGKVDSRQRERLKTIFFDALSSSDHLIVNIEKVEEFDNSFSALITSIRNTAKFLGKRLTIKGKAAAITSSARGHARHSV